MQQILKTTMMMLWQPLEVDGFIIIITKSIIIRIMTLMTTITQTTATIFLQHQNGHTPTN